MPFRWPVSDNELFLSGAGIGLLYGLTIRFGYRLFPNSPEFQLMTVGFMLLVPLAMGFITVYLVERKEPQGYAVWIFLPWISILGATLGSMLAAWEGFICAILFSPIAVVFGSFGGIIGGVAARSKASTHAKNLIVGCVLLLPLLVMPLEPRFFSSQEVRQVATSTDIQASPETVWRNIERVRAIQNDELRPSWTRRIGFPAPVEATLSREGLGGVRHASFAGGVMFVETVDVWEPDHRLAFSIHADTTQIPVTTLDEHVRVGGQYFDVLRGQYDIEALPNGNSRLHLSSQHRVSTDFNWYARLWTDAIMKDTQESILRVIKNRCEDEEGRQKTSSQTSPAHQFPAP
jgi:uncharacterized protein YndB with AHSA1/START domain